MAGAQAPRVLKIEFEFHVPKGLPRDIRGPRVENAVERIVSAVQGLVGTVFPWADKMTVRSSWAYVWRSPAAETIKLPKTTDNTVA